MAYAKRGVGDIYYVVDSKEDLLSIEIVNMGSTAWVIDEAIEYMANSKGQWFPQIPTNGKNEPINPENNYATVEYVDETFAKIIPYTEDEVSDMLDFDV